MAMRLYQPSPASWRRDQWGLCSTGGCPRVGTFVILDAPIPPYSYACVMTPRSAVEITYWLLPTGRDLGYSWCAFTTPSLRRDAEISGDYVPLAVARGSGPWLFLGLKKMKRTIFCWLQNKFGHAVMFEVQSSWDHACIHQNFIPTATTF